MLQSNISNYFLELRGVSMRFSASQSMFRQGDLVRFIYCIESGRAHLLRRDVDGRSLVMQRAGPGAILAEASLFAESYHCDAEAVTAVVAMAVPKALIRHHMTEHPEFSASITRHMAHEIQATRMHAEILSLKTVGARLDA